MRLYIARFFYLRHHVDNKTVAPIPLVAFHSVNILHLCGDYLSGMRNNVDNNSFLEVEKLIGVRPLA